MKRKKRRSADWNKKCLNPKCDKIHRVVDCDITPDEEKKSLLDAHYDAIKKAKSAKKVKKYGADNVVKVPDADEGRYRIFFDDCVPSIALGD